MNKFKYDLSVIIVSYNTVELLIDCIKSIIETTKKYSYEIIIVDNASVDGTIDKICNLKFADKSFSIKIIENKDNLGFSKANNIGVESSNGRYVLFLNPDTVVFENTIDGMISFMDKTVNAGASTCFVKLTNGKLDDASHRGFPTPWRAFCHFTGLSKIFPIKIFTGYNLSYLGYSTLHQIDACAGAFMIVRRAAGEKIGWWDEDYFWYGEDLDFCYKLKENKWQIFFVPNFEILHYKGASGGLKKISSKISKASNETKEKAIRSRFEAMRIFYKKHYLNKYPSCINSMVLMGIDFKYYITRTLNKT